MHKRPLAVFMRLGVAVTIACASATALAVSTRHFALDSASVLSEGKLEGTAVESSGVVTPGVEVTRHAIENVAVARSLWVDPDGTAYVGTGNEGKIYKLAGSKVSEFAKTGELLVSALVRDGKGTLYAGTLPKGKIFAIDKGGKATLFAEPKGAEHIWALVASKGALYAATGPEGKVFAIDKNGKSEVYYDSAADHVMALVAADDGALYAGTSDEALLLKITAPGKAEVVYDFEGNEVTALAVSEGRIAVAANLFPKPASSKARKTPPRKDDKKTEDKTGSKPASDQPKPGKGALWRIGADGRARKLFSSDKGHITAVQWAPGGAIYAAIGKEGHIYRVQPDGTHALWVDVDERQVLALHLTGKRPLFTTGDVAAIYSVEPGGARTARWISKVLDTRFRSRFGQLSWRGKGKISFQTRSGNTEKPDETWSEWSAVLTQPGPIRSQAARFLQIRADLDPGGGTELYAVHAYYLPRNQPVSITDVSVLPKQGKKGKKGESPDRPTTLYAVEWKIDNPDEDEQRYRLYYRPEGAAAWRAILKERDVQTATKYDWETEAIPDGFYRLKVEASDELDNPEASMLTAEGLSEPFRVDNHSPHIDGLRYANGRIVGTARDDLGPIEGLEYAIDGHEWKPFYPKDDLFDTRTEAFELVVPGLEAGPHVIAIRATDARHNSTTGEVEITVK